MNIFNAYLKIQLTIFLMLYSTMTVASDVALMNVNGPVQPPYGANNNNGFEDLLIIEMFRRMGYKVNLQHLPAERGLVNLNQGIDDAIQSRIGGLEKKYPNIVMIPEPVYARNYIAFTNRDDVRISGWSDFENYNVALIRGWKIFEKNIKKYKSLKKVRGPEQLFKLLDAGRVDVVVYALDPGLWKINKLGLKNIRPIAPALAKKDKYFYVHKRHKDVAPEAVKTLQNMKTDGTLETIKNKTLNIK